LGLCFALSGWIALYGLDQSVGEEGQNTSSGQGWEIYEESIARQTGGSVEEAKSARGDARGGTFQTAHPFRKTCEVESVATEKDLRPCPVTGRSLPALDP